MDQHTNNENTQQDAFSLVTLAGAALHPTGAHVFRAQHEQMLRKLDSISGLLEAPHTTNDGPAERALQIRHAMTSFSVMFSVHQAVEDALLRSLLGREPRVRVLLDQFEREIQPLKSEVNSLLRRYPSPSVILREMSDFTATFPSLSLKIQERLRTEERELYPLYDRALHVATPGAEMPSAA